MNRMNNNIQHSTHSMTVYGEHGPVNLNGENTDVILNANTYDDTRSALKNSSLKIRCTSDKIYGETQAGLELYNDSGELATIKAGLGQFEGIDVSGVIGGNFNGTFFGKFSGKLGSGVTNDGSRNTMEFYKGGNNYIFPFKRAELSKGVYALDAGSYEMIFMFYKKTITSSSPSHDIIGIHLISCNFDYTDFKGEVISTGGNDYQISFTTAVALPIPEDETYITAYQVL